MATFTINVSAYVNVAPTLGNITATTSNRTALPFTKAMFTSTFADTKDGTTPTNIKFVTLPTADKGTLKYEGVNILANRIVSFNDITKITFEPVPTDSALIASFIVQASDSEDSYSS